MTMTNGAEGAFPAFIVTDLDGTLLTDEKGLPQKNVQAIKSLKRLGVPVFFCTGRPISFVEKYVRLAGASSLVIGGNGAIIRNIFTGETVFQQCFEKETQKNLLEFCFAQGFDALAYGTDGTVFFSKESRRVRVFLEYNDSLQDGSVSKVKLFPLEAVMENMDSVPIYKVLVTERPIGAQGDVARKNDLERLNHFLGTMPAVYAVPSMAGVMDIMPQAVSKGKAVVTLAEYLRVPLSMVGVIGDNQNDISMFQIAGTSVCMSNGSEDAKKMAQWVTADTNNEAGFAEAVEWLRVALNLE